MLALRNPLDTAPTKTEGARLSALLGEASPVPVKKMVEGRTIVKAVPRPEPSAPPRYTVETIRAAKRSEEEVR